MRWEFPRSVTESQAAVVALPVWGRKFHIAGPHGLTSSSEPKITTRRGCVIQEPGVTGRGRKLGTQKVQDGLNNRRLLLATGQAGVDRHVEQSPIAEHALQPMVQQVVAYREARKRRDSHAGQRAGATDFGIVAVECDAAWCQCDRGFGTVAACG